MDMFTSYYFVGLLSLGCTIPTALCIRQTQTQTQTADGRRDMYVLGRRVYSADGKFTIYTVDLVIFACLEPPNIRCLCFESESECESDQSYVSGSIRIFV